jgi:hypothetical protein
LIHPTEGTRNKAEFAADSKRAYQKEKKGFDQEWTGFDADVLSLSVLTGAVNHFRLQPNFLVKMD